MSILSRYVLKAHLVPAAAGLAIFYFVLSMDFIVDYLNLFIAKGVPAWAVLEAFGLSLAWMTVLAVPMSVMVGVLTAFGRLSGDNEITAAKSNGVNAFSLIMPVLLAAIVISLGLFQFGNQVLPDANYRLKALLIDIHRIRPLATIEPGVLTRLPGGYRIIVGRLDPQTSQIFDVRIHRMEGDDPLQTIVAKSGKISTSESDGTIKIQLFDGEIHELDPDDPTRYSRLLFERHTINVDQGTTELVRSERAKRGDREMTLAELKESMTAEFQSAEESRGRMDELLASIGRLEDTEGSQKASDDSSGVAAAETQKTAPTKSDLLRKVDSEDRNRRSALRKARKLQVEYYKKFSIPFSCIVFVLLGAPLGIRSRRGGVGIGAGIGILFFLAYYLFLIGGEQLGDRGIVNPMLAMWAPNIVFGGVGAYLTLATCLEWRSRILGRLFSPLARRGAVTTSGSAPL